MHLEYCKRQTNFVPCNSQEEEEKEGGGGGGGGKACCSEINQSMSWLQSKVSSMAACPGAAASSSKMQIIISASCCCCCCSSSSSSLRRGVGRGRRGLAFSTNAQYMNLNGILSEEKKMIQSIMSCCCCCCCCRYSKFSSVAAGISRNLQFLCSCKSAVRRRRLIRHLDFMPRDQKIYRIGDQIDSVAAGIVMKAGLVQDQAFGLGNIVRGSELLDRFSQADGGAVRQLPVIKGAAGSINLRPLVAAMATSLRDQKNIDHDLVQTPESVQPEISHGSTTPEQEMMMRATSMQQPQQKVAVNGSAPSSSTSLLLRHPAAGLQQLIDHSASEEGSARLIDDGILYRQNFVIRSYEVDANRTATLETLTNLFQVHRHCCIMQLPYMHAWVCDLRWGKVDSFLIVLGKVKLLLKGRVLIPHFPPYRDRLVEIHMCSFWWRRSP